MLHSYIASSDIIITSTPSNLLGAYGGN